ncbi:MAG: S-layer homology domain-containing protein [Clostridia bacterium]|nr:S-layer homology domain-containing protein [Clostridia bacterium]
MSLFKKTTAYIFVTATLCVLVFIMGVTLSAKTDDRGHSFSVSIDTEGLISYLEKSMKDCPKRVDVSEFGIPYTTEDGIAIQKLVWHGTPVLFHVNGIGLSGSNGIIDYLYFTYHYDAATYQRMYDDCVSAAKKMTADLVNNKSLTDVTKALILHDRIIADCEYDLAGVSAGNISNESQEMYGALVDGVASCQGYAYAYMYLLREVGIDSYICSSEDMHHDWNIVILNGKKYHVDVTFDDPVQDVTGRVYHDYFLLSTAALKKAEHNFNDYDTSPSDTTYDNYYWKNSRAQFCLVNGEVYYIDNIKETLNRLGTSTPLTKVSDVWTTAEGNYWRGNFVRMATDGVSLFYSKTKAVYAYDISSARSREIYKPSFSGEARDIYGFTYDGGYLVIDRFNRPDFASHTKSKYQLRVPYDTEAPTASLTYTNDTAAYQTVTLKLSDNNGIAGYYWGRNSLPSGNDYTATHTTTVTEYVSEPGIYYLTAQDAAGNLSESVSVTFCSTRLETDGASVSTSTVISVKGERIALPVPKRAGYDFIGWSKSYTDSGEYLSYHTPTADGVLYALWRYTGEQDNKDPEDYVNRFKDVSDSAWYADAVAYCASRGYINGVSATAFSPASYLTREQFVLILANVAGVNADSYKFADSGMKDVRIGQWYSGAVAWGVSEGYVKGVATDRFGLRQNITREQLARLFYVYAEDIGMDVKGRAELGGFKDSAKVSSWAYEQVCWAVDQGIISGMTEDTLAPRGNATRAQTARMFMIFDKLNKK